MIYMISVQVIRRIDTRIPTPLLSTFITPATPGLGKLADFRAVKATQTSRSSSPSWRPTAAVPPVITKSWNTTTTQSQGSSSNAPVQRGWTSVVASGASSSSSAAANNASTQSSSSMFTPKPTTSSASPKVLPVSSHNLTLGVLVVGSSLSRTVSPAHIPSEPVPEDWEDDV